MRVVQWLRRLVGGLFIRPNNVVPGAMRRRAVFGQPAQAKTFLPSWLFSRRWEKREGEGEDRAKENVKL
jgi:hypothetical protein